MSLLFHIQTPRGSFQISGLPANLRDSRARRERWYSLTTSSAETKCASSRDVRGERGEGRRPGRAGRIHPGSEVAGDPEWRSSEWRGVPLNIRNPN